MSILAEQTAAFAEMGLWPSTATPCPRLVAGRRCLRLPPPCICRLHTGVLEHARIWIDEHGNRVLTSEPDSLDGKAIADYVHDLAELGLEAMITGNAHRHPAAVLIIVRRAAWPYTTTARDTRDTRDTDSPGGPNER